MAYYKIVFLFIIVLQLFGCNKETISSSEKEVVPNINLGTTRYSEFIKHTKPSSFKRESDDIYLYCKYQNKERTQTLTLGVNHSDIADSDIISAIYIESISNNKTSYPILENNYFIMNGIFFIGMKKNDFLNTINYNNNNFIEKKNRYYYYKKTDIGLIESVSILFNEETQCIETMTIYLGP